MQQNKTKQEKLEELIKFIHENKGLPKRNKNKELFIFYTALQQGANRANKQKKKKLSIGKIAKENIEYYNLVEKALSCYKESKEEKIKKLINFVKENHRLPKQKQYNNGVSESLYSDKTDMYEFYATFIQISRNLKEKEKQEKTLTEEEFHFLSYYEILMKELKKYKMTKEEKVNELIDFIKEQKRLPKQKVYNDGQFEALYRDGTDMRSFYEVLIRDVNRIKQNAYPLIKNEQETLKYYDKIQEALNSVCITKEEKLEVIINYIRKNRRLPSKKNAPQYLYQDGTSMRNFYLYLNNKVKEIEKKINTHEPLSKTEQENLEYFNKIEKELQACKMTKEEKVNELIDFIKENHRLPRQKQYNNGVNETLYLDKTDMNRFYASLMRSYKRAMEYQEQGKRLTKKQEQDITYYKKVRLALDYYKENNQIEISNIVEYLENLRKNNAYEEMILLCEVIIENKSLTEEEQENLKNVFERYMMHVKQEESEKVKIKQFSNL